MEKKSPTIGIGACLVGMSVRYNGDSKRKNQYIEGPIEHVKLRTFCPEAGTGLTVSREPVRLEGDLGTERLMDSSTPVNGSGGIFTAELRRLDRCCPWIFMQPYAEQLSLRNLI
ncbi:MAG: hypothetical protein ACI8QT_002052 [Halioglobus sp.]|jgi:uncharacterized protein YbbK (DUF523 family)